MKITVNSLRKIIKEEVKRTMKENHSSTAKVVLDYGEFPGDPEELMHAPKATLKLIQDQMEEYGQVPYGLIGAKVVSVVGPAGGNPEVELTFANKHDAESTLRALGYDLEDLHIEVA
jgi:hypothetical protein